MVLMKQKQYKHTLPLYIVLTEEDQFQVFKKNGKFHLTSMLQKPNSSMHFRRELTTGLKNNLCKLFC